MLQNMDRLISQIDLMETLCERPLGLGWVQQAIRDSAQEIERLEPGDLAARYARDIVKTLGELCSTARVPTAMIANSRLDEQIHALAQYVESLANSSASLNAG